MSRTACVDRSEMDSHADTCVAGCNMVVLEDTGQTVSVTPFTSEYNALKGIPIVSAATAYDCPTDGETYLLIFNECLFLGERLPVSLLCPNQLRAFGLSVCDTPQQFDADSPHDISFPDSNLRIPLEMEGVVSYFTSRRPTDDEIATCARLEMTSAAAWDPRSPHFRQTETQLRERGDSSISMVSTTMQLSGTGTRGNLHEVMSLMTPREILAVASAEDGLLAERLEEMVNVSGGDLRGDGICMIGSEHELYAVATSLPDSVITKEVLAKRWGLGLETAKRTLEVTTQAGIRKYVHPVARRFKTRQQAIRYPRLSGKFYTDTMFSPTVSLRGYTCAQVFTDGYGYDEFYPLKSKADASRGLLGFIQESGVPGWLISDGALEQRTRHWQDVVRDYQIRQTLTEPYSPWQNKAESSIRAIKRGIRRFMQSEGSPKRTWCFCGEWYAGTRRLTAHDTPVLNGRVPAERVGGDTPDISMYVQFSWYQWVHFLDHDGETKLGRWLGPARGIGSGNCHWILPISCRPIARSTVFLIGDEVERARHTIEAKQHFDEKVQDKIGDSRRQSEVEEDFDGLFPSIEEVQEAEQDADDDIEPLESESTRSDADEFTPESMDEYISASVLLPRGEDVVRAKVVGRMHGRDGNPLGMRHSNPILDTREYQVEFPDGSTATYAANVIAENLYSQVDEEGRHFAILQEITDHKRDGSALSKDDGFIENRHGQRRPKLTTRGWKLLVSWKDGSTDWIPLKDLKESNPVEVAEYAVANKIAEEPAFAWWVRDVLRRRDRVIKKVKSTKYWLRSHKYGVELPKTVAEALAIDRRTGTTFWRDAIEKEMRNVMVAFEFSDDPNPPVGYAKATCHMIFDIKFDLTRKARLVLNGAKHEVPKEMTFSSVVSRDSVRIAFTLAALNGLDILAADIQNAYLSAPTEERLYVVAGLEFPPDLRGRPAKIVRALYGMKSSGARFRDHLAASLRDMGYKSCKADPDVWMKAATKADGTKFYSYVLAYVDDILCLDTNPKQVMDALSKVYKLKDGSVKAPDVYLGAEVKQFKIPESDEPGKIRWAMSSSKYVARAIRDVETELENVGLGLPKRTTTPLSQGYRPELDQTAELDAQRLNYYQGLVGVLRWICELGRVDILMPVSLMSRYLVSAREGHLQQLFHVFAYLKQYDRSTMVFDDTEPCYDPRRFATQDWSKYYPDAKEAIPENMPEPRGRPVMMTCFVDADHAGCQLTRRSHTGVILYINRAPIIWYSKRQNTVESSTFGSEFIAMKIAVELIEGLRYKLRMMGVPVEDPCNVFCDNEAVVKNSTRPESTLKKKHQAIAYHRTREAQAAGTVRIAKEDGETNLADIFTKLLAGPKLRDLSQRILW